MTSWPIRWWETKSNRGASPNRAKPMAPIAGWPSAPITTPAEKVINSSTMSAANSDAANAPPPSQNTR
eukprot:CAMPEP_0184460888 /NCGR_PEP_ID=MMETSP0740-20130409/42299_1 /TAXON_ID=385413 /ORGANISM="Thalassiosira miniscula, Strain CCMP1093" /LENGTH=67 /DNA_ID=CAMNT_0026834337 /DNA_START=201 /DNA_END=401 /DNA_ORIENTATION=+